MRHRSRYPDPFYAGMVINDQSTPHQPGPFRDEYAFASHRGAAAGARSVADADAPNLTGTWRMTDPSTWSKRQGGR